MSLTGPAAFCIFTMPASSLLFLPHSHSHLSFPLSFLLSMEMMSQVEALRISSEPETSLTQGCRVQKEGDNRQIYCVI